MKTRITMTDDREFDGIWSFELWADTEENFDQLASSIEDIANLCGCPDDSEGYADTFTAPLMGGTKADWIKDIRKAIKQAKEETR